MHLFSSNVVILREFTKVKTVFSMCLSLPKANVVLGSEQLARRQL